MRIKICGITKPDQGYAIAKMGATALGFICVPASKRYVSPQQIQAVIELLMLNSIDRIGVFANSTIKEICQVINQTNLTGVQLHGDESPEFCLELRKLLPGVEIIKALRVGYSESQGVPLQIAQRQAEIYSVCVDSLLLDAYHPQMLGGTGQTLNWEMLREFRPACAWFLAGGLTPDNVLEALKQVKPSGIDLSSGVEISPGNKDLTKVAKLFEVLNR